MPHLACLDVNPGGVFTAAIYLISTATDNQSAMAAITTDADVAFIDNDLYPAERGGHNAESCSYTQPPRTTRHWPTK